MLIQNGADVNAVQKDECDGTSYFEVGKLVRRVISDVCLIENGVVMNAVDTSALAVAALSDI